MKRWGHAGVKLQGANRTRCAYARSANARSAKTQFLETIHLFLRASAGIMSFQVAETANNVGHVLNEIVFSNRQRGSLCTVQSNAHVLQLHFCQQAKERALVYLTLPYIKSRSADWPSHQANRSRHAAARNMAAAGRFMHAVH
jgi:hypothetical protein